MTESGPIASASATPAPGLGAPAAGSRAMAHEDPLVGKIILDRYLIQRKLGEGGMGAVYLAQHTMLEKPVALKLLHGEFLRKPDLVERFMQEAKAASRIRHDNVIDISDYGQTPDGLVFFVMELLSGHDLHEEVTRARLAGRRIPWSRSRPIFLQICSALAAAHARGIIHRDLKPENIYLIERLGQRDFVKLLDFGIAKQTEVSEGERKLTKTGMLFGTPEYMSPEQARGETIDPRVDVYAMGCILYQLVTGRVPFEADSFMAVLSQHLTTPPPPIPPAIFQEIGAPIELEDIIIKALAKEREQRFQTIDDLANSIRSLHGEAAVPRARRPSSVADDWSGRAQHTGEAATPSRKTSKAPWIAVGLLVAGAAGAGAFVLGSSGNRAPAGVAPGDGATVGAPGAIAPVATDAGVAPQGDASAVAPSPADAGAVDPKRPHRRADAGVKAVTPDPGPGPTARPDPDEDGPEPLHNPFERSGAAAPAPSEPAAAPPASAAKP